MFPPGQAFLLYDSKGFPLDLTQRMAEEAGLTVDVAAYNQCMERQREMSKVGFLRGWSVHSLANCVTLADSGALRYRRGLHLCSFTKLDSELGPVMLSAVSWSWKRLRRRI